MPTYSFKDAKREQTAITANIERMALNWFAARMPRWVSPDNLSLLGFAAMIMAGVGYYLAGSNLAILHLVNLCLALNWFGDSLDGTLARYRNKQRPRYGFYVDHIIDMFGTFALMGGLSLSGFMTPRIAMFALILFLMMAINSYLTAYTLGVFQLSYGKFGPTELRILLLMGNLTLIYHNHGFVLGKKFLLFDVGGVVGVVAMFVVLVYSTIKNTHALYCEERV